MIKSAHVCTGQLSKSEQSETVGNSVQVISFLIHSFFFFDPHINPFK